MIRSMVLAKITARFADCCRVLQMKPPVRVLGDDDAALTTATTHEGVHGGPERRSDAKGHLRMAEHQLHESRKGEAPENTDRSLFVVLHLPNVGIWQLVRRRVTTRDAHHSNIQQFRCFFAYGVEAI